MAEVSLRRADRCRELPRFEPIVLPVEAKQWGSASHGGHSAVGGSSTGHPVVDPPAAGGLNVGTSIDPNPAAGSTAAEGTEARADGGNPAAGGTAGTNPEPPPETDDAALTNGPWIPDLGDGTYKNPVIHADYSDPDVVRVGSDYYMTSSSFNCTPGLQILHSKDLINWRIIGYVFEQQPPYDDYVEPQTLNGVWAPSIRHHNDTFYITYGNPDKGIYLAKAKDPRGPWMLDNIYPGRGMIDPCPFWDSDGQGYVVHAWAGSRAGFNSTLTLRKLSADESSLSDEEILVIDGNKTAPGLFKTVEGPKMYKRGSLYYIFAPAGGVTEGWQMVLRSTSLEGPWEYKKVLEQGDTPVNGPHQGAWVTTPDEKESWFFHFQEKDMYGRVVHLQPVVWEGDWPVMGNNGKPVLRHTKPAVGGTYPILTPQTSDDFSSPTLGLQWQWYANSKQEWASLTDNPGHLRLPAVPMPSSNYVKLPNLLLQKFPADSFSFTAKLTVQLQTEGNTRV